MRDQTIEELIEIVEEMGWRVERITDPSCLLLYIIARQNQEIINRLDGIDESLDQLGRFKGAWL